MTWNDLDVCVPQGIVFLPKRTSVQRMLLRADTPYALPARKSVSKRIPVLCMDIAKAPPSSRETAWTHIFDTERSKLVAFTRQRAATEARRRSDATLDQIEKFLLRFVIWRYNGATQADVAAFILQYGSIAEKMEADNRSKEIIRMVDTIIAAFRRDQRVGE